MQRKTPPVLFLVLLLTFLFAPVFLCSLSAAEKCLKCHKKLTTGKFKHKALDMGCSACHSAINAGTVPHKKTGAIARGLSSEQPDLCYGCHDQGMFSKKNVHAAVSMGCTSCHNPHSSGNEKLLMSKPPMLCFSCHDKTGFTGKIAHQPVASGDCMICHSPHATDDISLLLNKPAALCLQCHPNAGHGRHSPRQLPVSEQAEGKTQEPELKDPLRPDRPFYCGSCHNPHGADVPSLLRFNAKSSKEFCLHCHKW
ncbi:MAG TPA: cytochrome c3 family protein [Nitrospirota bacterium]